MINDQLIAKITLLYHLISSEFICNQSNCLFIVNFMRLIDNKGLFTV